MGCRQIQGPFPSHVLARGTSCGTPAQTALLLDGYASCDRARCFMSCVQVLCARCDVRRERLGPIRHKIGEVCREFWAIKPLLTMRALSLPARLQRLLANISPIFPWGAPAWELRKASITMHEFRPATEKWLGWHLRTWRRTREAPMADWGCRPPVIVAVCAVSGVRRLAIWPVCSVMGRDLRWRSLPCNTLPWDLSGGGTDPVADALA